MIMIMTSSSHRLCLSFVFVFFLAPRFASAASPGFRALKLELDVASRRLVIGELVDEIPKPVLTATSAGSSVRLYPDLWSSRLPVRWSIGLEILDASGKVLDRPMPVIGAGIPPLVVEIPAPPRGRFLRAALEVSDPVERARSRPVIVPALTLPLSSPRATIVIDRKERVLPLDASGHAAITFDLDVPATVRLRIEDGLGAWWNVSRVVTASRVVRPLERTPRAISLFGGVLRLGASEQRRVPAPQPWIASTWIENGRTLAVGLLGTRGVSAWRLVLSDRSGVLLAEAAGESAPPDVARLALPSFVVARSLPAVLRLEAQHELGYRVIGAPLELPALSEPADWAISVPPERAALDRLALVVRLRQGPLGGVVMKDGDSIDASMSIFEIGDAPGPVVLLPIGELPK